MLAFFKSRDKLIDDVQHSGFPELLKVVQEQGKRYVDEGQVSKQRFRLGHSRTRASERLWARFQLAGQGAREASPEYVREAGQLVICRVEVYPRHRQFAPLKRLRDLLEDSGLAEAGRRAHGYHRRLRTFHTGEQRLSGNCDHGWTRWRQLGTSNAAFAEGASRHGKDGAKRPFRYLTCTQIHGFPGLLIRSPTRRMRRHRQPRRAR